MNEVYKNAKVYGPYRLKTNRMNTFIVFDDKTKKTTSYARYLMEVHLNRYLSKDEQVDHIDGNPLNNDISNLQVVPSIVHQIMDVKRRKDQNLICVWCGKEFLKKGSKLNNIGRKAGPFCSRKCSGTYGAAVQNNVVEKFPKASIEKTYNRNKDLLNDKFSHG